MQIQELIRKENAKIVDVRTPNEFFGGNIEGSVNIPLNEIQHRLDEVRKLGSPLVLCCASGIRSKIGTDILKQNDINCYDGGSWIEVLSCINC